jgi:superfamily II DNA/RNA helicase
MEAILLGINSLVIAGTGTGKTMPFMMPLMLDSKKKALIISPLKILQANQVCLCSTTPISCLIFLQVSRFEKAKVSAVAVNGESWSTQLLQVCRVIDLWESLMDVKLSRN